MITHVLGEIEVVELKFKDTTGAKWVLDTDIVTWGRDNPPDNIADVGVYMSPDTSHVLSMTKPKVTPILGLPNGSTCKRTESSKSVKCQLKFLANSSSCR